MTSSMTGYAAKDALVENGNLTVEIRAVNSRYLDLHFKLDDALKPLEACIRELLKAGLNRGKVECKISYVAQSSNTESLQLNDGFVERLSNLSQQVQHALPNSAELSVAEVMKWPGVLVQNGTNKDAIQETAMQLVKGVTEEMKAARLREGEKLKAIILERIVDVEILIEKVKPLMGALVQGHRKKIEDKLSEAVKSLDAERITQELVLYAQRIDVDEELVRLTTHVGEVKRILNEKKPAGKRLDFMMQELNREANTLGAKSISIETTQVSMELKVLIEQMREQVQNIE